MTNAATQQYSKCCCRLDAVAASAEGTFGDGIDGSADVAPEPVGGPFALSDHNSQPRTDADFRGKLLLIYFGPALLVTCRAE